MGRSWPVLEGTVCTKGGHSWGIEELGAELIGWLGAGEWWGGNSLEG